ncbi:peptide chain release factor 2 [Helicobacter sp. 11S02629-2]|uniref:peptide chain release factor 2 n=1 Tax=Helicobacter sp. 11S02629-2 TaxID=1476195 RepID=UPI000BA4F764|nr:peptide chain release factor 2 [Helicobacter sp. 11S02629-2]PAF45312.1 peptide chain release factor 2 [Helicobacter sp. 11S02629-2]
MDSYEYGELLKTLSTKTTNIEKIINPTHIKERLKDIESKSLDKDFWEDASLASKLLKEKQRLNSLLSAYITASDNLKDASELYEMSLGTEDNDTLELLYLDSEGLENSIKDLEIKVMLSDELDSMNAIFTIQPGAGGTESMDWCLMLYRMYVRWAQRRGFKLELLDYQEGEEAGLKGVSFIIRGENAYGYAKVESGVHRLVRISPFDSNAKRHTSFVSVQVSPELDDNIDIEILDKDIRIDTYRASGAGGQHVNKTESAIRITHIPTGIVVQCQNDRSQHKNKATALKMLTSKLYALEKQKNTDRANSNDKSEMGFGYQIRSYVLAPYQQVKDTRSNLAYSNTQAILDGEIDSIMEGVLVSLNQAK